MKIIAPALAEVLVKVNFDELPIDLRHDSIDFIVKYDVTPVPIEGILSTDPIMEALTWGSAEIYRIDDTEELALFVSNVGIDEAEDVKAVVYYRLISGHVLEEYIFNDKRGSREYSLFTASQWETINEMAQRLMDAIDLLVPSSNNTQ